jgi:hypothetical protein
MNKIDALRNLMGLLNRHKNPTAANVVTINNLLSPPYKGLAPNPVVYTYPECLSGLHGEGKQRINMSGNTSGSAIPLA